MEDFESKSSYLFSDEVSKFLIVLQGATRARPNTDEAIFVPPVNAAQVNSEYHHFVFGQRGSGKSTLLRQLQSEKSSEGKIAAWIDQEVFANLSFPDVLVSSIEALFSGVLRTLDNHLQQQRGEVPKWRRWAMRPSRDDRLLRTDLAGAVNNLRELKFAPLESSIEWTKSHSSEERDGVVGSIKIRQAGVNAELARKTGTSVESKETVLTSKGEYLERSLPDYRALLLRAATRTGGGLVFLDDLYHLDSNDQPRVLGYMHRLLKDTGLWLKVGSIRYLTRTYTATGQPVGMQSGQDAHLIALDEGMQTLQLSSRWLESILRELAPRAGVSIDELFSPGSLNRLALASGCIARDYLTIVGNAITNARNRPESTKSGSHRVTVEDVNRAAGVLAPSKLDDMQKDSPEAAASSRAIINELTAFCRRTKRAYFLVEVGDAELSERMESLRHLRFVHLLERSESVKSDSIARYDVWLLDVSQLAAHRATQQMDFIGWSDREKRRSAALIFSRP